MKGQCCQSNPQRDFDYCNLRGAEVDTESPDREVCRGDRPFCPAASGVSYVEVISGKAGQGVGYALSGLFDSIVSR